MEHKKTTGKSRIQGRTRFTRMKGLITGVLKHFREEIIDALKKVGVTIFGNKLNFFGAIASIIALFFAVGSVSSIISSNREFKESKREFRQSQENIVAGQIASRFSQAIKLLSEEKATTRKGAIYALEQIAKESPQTYLQTVLDILTSFVKDFDKFKYKDGEKSEDKTYAKIKDMLDAIDKKEIGDEQKDEEKTPIFDNIDIFPEVEAALKVLGRVRNQALARFESEPPPFEKINEYKIDLKGAHLIKAKFVKTDLRGASLWNADLRGAYLWEADLREAFLGNANLENAYLMRAKLDSAVLIKSDLSGADLSEANLTGANLRGANLSGAVLQGADLSKAIFTGANLREADLSEFQSEEGTIKANLSGAIGLTFDQISEAKCLWGVKGLDPSLKAELIKRKPELFKKDCKDQ